MTPEQLKSSILQWAVQGKLVEQRLEEGTAEELYQEIKIKENELPSVLEEEKEFDIPDSWMWVKLGNILKISTGKRDANHGKENGKYDFFTCSSEPIKADTYSYDGECLIAPGNGANVGLVIYYNGKFEAYQRTYVLEKYNNKCNLIYLKYVMDWNWKRYNANKMFGSAIPYIKLGNLQNYCFPLPPFEEQKRIVAKIEELLPLVECYSKAYGKLESFNEKFPEKMKRSILQYAIQGKLVEQKPEEGTAEELYQQIQEEKQKLIKEGKINKEKLLAEITEEEKPFDIPDSWKWVSIGDTCVGFDYGTAKKSSPNGKRAVLRMGNIQKGKVIFDNLVYSNDDEDIQKYDLLQGDLLFNRTNSKEWVGKTAIYEGQMPAIYAGYLVRFRPILFDSKYLNHVMQSQYYWSFCQRERTDAIGQSNINAQKLKKFVFPLPPLEEQHRIVAKIEELLPYCDLLKG